MDRLCAWCQKEGKPALMGRTATEGPATHGICEPHQAVMREEMRRLREQREALLQGGTR